MGAQKYQKDIEALFDKSPVVDARSIERLVKSKGKVRQYYKQIIRNLLKSGRIKRLAKGFYTTRDDPSLAVFAFQPAYLGLQDALSVHGLSEQETIPVIVTARKVRQGIRKVMGQNELVRRLDKRYLFGFEYQKHGTLYLPYSDLEKTLIDIFYFRANLSPEVSREARKRVDMKRLSSYLKAYPGKFRKDFLRAAQLQ